MSLPSVFGMYPGNIWRNFGQSNGQEGEMQEGKHKLRCMEQNRGQSSSEDRDSVKACRIICMYTFPVNLHAVLAYIINRLFYFPFALFITCCIAYLEQWTDAFRKFNVLRCSVHDCLRPFSLGIYKNVDNIIKITGKKTIQRMVTFMIKKIQSINETR